MLVIPEKDRISWEEIFNLSIIKMDNKQLKLNMQ